MLRELASGLRKPLADGMNGQRGTRYDPQRGVRERVHPLGMHIFTKERVHKPMDLVKPKAKTLRHTDLPPSGVGIA